MQEKLEKRLYHLHNPLHHHSIGTWQYSHHYDKTIVHHYIHDYKTAHPLLIRNPRFDHSDVSYLHICHYGNGIIQANNLFANKGSRIHLSHPDNQLFDCKSYYDVGIRHFLDIEIHAHLKRIFISYSNLYLC